MDVFEYRSPANSPSNSAPALSRGGTPRVSAPLWTAEFVFFGVFVWGLLGVGWCVLLMFSVVESVFFWGDCCAIGLGC